MKDCIEFKIRKVLNGCILQHVSPIIGETDAIQEIVSIDQDGLFQCEHECFAEFLRSINENFGPNDSKYSPKRIYVKVDPGHGTDAQSEDNDSAYKHFLDKKIDNMSFEKWGRIVYEEMERDLKYSLDFKSKYEYKS